MRMFIIFGGTDMLSPHSYTSVFLNVYAVMLSVASQDELKIPYDGLLPFKQITRIFLVALEILLRLLADIEVSLLFRHCLRSI